jgi:hypothetical protein
MHVREHGRRRQPIQIRADLGLERGASLPQAKQKPIDPGEVSYVIWGPGNDDLGDEIDQDILVPSGPERASRSLEMLSPAAGLFAGETPGENPQGNAQAAGRVCRLTQTWGSVVTGDRPGLFQQGVPMLPQDLAG